MADEEHSDAEQAWLFEEHSVPLEPLITGQAAPPPAVELGDPIEAPNHPNAADVVRALHRQNPALVQSLILLARSRRDEPPAGQQHGQIVPSNAPSLPMDAHERQSGGGDDDDDDDDEQAVSPLLSVHDEPPPVQLQGQIVPSSALSLPIQMDVHERQSGDYDRLNREQAVSQPNPLLTPFYPTQPISLDQPVVTLQQHQRQGNPAPRRRERMTTVMNTVGSRTKIRRITSQEVGETSSSSSSLSSSLPSTSSTSTSSVPDITTPDIDRSADPDRS